MITAADILTSNGKRPDICETHDATDEVCKNAEELARRVNIVLALFGRSRRVRSGWRPREINAATPGAALNSHHITASAVDIADDNKKLGEWVIRNTAQLATAGLWCEHPVDTPTWVHFQLHPPKSGRRIFNK